MARIEGDELDKRSKGNWLDLENDGDYAIIAFIGKPIGLELIWSNAQNRNVLYDKTVHDKNDMRLHVFWNVWDKQREEILIWDRYPKIYRQYQKSVVATNKHNHWWRITRVGEKKPSYGFSDEGEIDPETYQEIQGLETIDPEDLFVKKDAKKKSGPSTANKPAATEESASLSQNEIAEIEESLSQLPGKIKLEFMETFDVAKVKKLKRQDLDRVRKFLAEAKKDHPPKDQDPFENDDDDD